MKLVRAKQLALDANLIVHAYEQENYESALVLLLELIARALTMKDELINEGVAIE